MNLIRERDNGEAIPELVNGVVDSGQSHWEKEDESHQGLHLDASHGVGHHSDPGTRMLCPT